MKCDKRPNALAGLRLLDLFAGAGGLSLGFHQAGFPPGVLIDNCHQSVETLDVNFTTAGATVLQRDLAKFSPSHLRDALKRLGVSSHFDLVMGGPPCQGWSKVGRGKLRSLGRRGQDVFGDPRNQLYKKYLRFVRCFQPLVCVMENVPGMLSVGGTNVAEWVAESIAEAGYVVTWALVNAVDYGIPQIRERLIFVGVREDLKTKFAFPPTHDEDNDRLFPLVSVRDAIGDLPRISNGSSDWVRPYKVRKQISRYARMMRAGADRYTVFDHVCRSQNEQDVEAFGIMKQGGWYRDLPKRFKRYRDDIFEDKYKKLYWRRPSWCVTAHLGKDCYTHIHPYQARTISVREAARLQSFPDSFYFSGCMGDKFRQIGNAVPPLLAEVIATAIRDQVFARRGRSRVASRIAA